MSDGGVESLRIRVYQADDEAGVISLWDEVFPDDPPWNKPLDVIRAKLAFQPEWFFVCCDRGDVVGTVLAGYDGVRGWVQKVAVHPSYRRSGIAHKLMAIAEDALRQAGCTKLNLQTRAGNDSAIRFYEAAGYDVEDRVSMSKRL